MYIQYIHGHKSGFWQHTFIAMIQCDVAGDMKDIPSESFTLLSNYWNYLPAFPN